MAAPVLRHYTAVSNATANTFDTVLTVPANRALVISKIVVVNNLGSGSTTFNVRAGGVGKSVTGVVTLPFGQTYTETGIVLVAGEILDHSSGNASGTVIHVFGEEVDN
jgi:hypothetical protein